MNEKTLLIVCYVLAFLFVWPSRRRMSGMKYWTCLLLGPLLLYVLILICLAGLAIMCGDK